jgi:hypothetical protein
LEASHHLTDDENTIKETLWQRLFAGHAEYRHLLSTPANKNRNFQMFSKRVRIFQDKNGL